MAGLNGLRTSGIRDLGRFDVVVIGGGAAGSAAAIRAGRLGMSCLLVDPLSFLGGTGTGAQVTPWMNNRIPLGQLNEGLNGELQRDLERLGDARGYFVNPQTLQHLLEVKAIEAGVTLLYETTLVGVQTENADGASRPVSVTLATRRGLCCAEAGTFIDASGDAELATAAGVPTLSGRDEDGVHQPMSLRFVIGNVDIQAMADGLRRKIGPNALIDINGYLTNGELEAHFISLAERAGWPANWIKTFSIQFFEIPGRPRELWFNCPRLAGFDPLDPLSLSLAYVEGRRLIDAYVELFREYVPGCKDCFLASVAPLMGIREGRRIRGRYMLTRDDFLQSRKFDDGICMNRYPIDIHNPHGQGALNMRRLPPGQWHDIPFRCLVPLGAKGLLVAGRCISSDFDSHASYRIIPNCRTLGEAAAVAADIARQQGCDVTEVDGIEVRRQMLNLEILPPFASPS